MKALELVTESLEVLEDESGVFNDRLFSRFYDCAPGAEDLMAHMDDLMKGKMLEEVIRLLLADDFDSEAEYLDFELKNHETAYSVDHGMYRPLFDSFYETVKEFVKDGWRSEFDTAWQTRIDEVMSALDAHSPAAS